MPDTSPAVTQKATSQSISAYGTDVTSRAEANALPTATSERAHFDIESATEELIDAVDLPDGLDATTVREALTADDFVTVGIASIQQYDVDAQRITMDALSAARDRYLHSEDAPGVISRGHDDVIVGRPVEAYTFSSPADISVNGESYAFDAGDTVQTGVKADADDDGLPELWLVSRLANDSALALQTRYEALTGDLNGFSVTVGPRDGAATKAGTDITAVDWYATTVGTDEQIKNKGSEFDVAEFKLDTLPAAATATIRRHAAALTNSDMSNNDTDDKTGLVARILRKSADDLEEADADATPADEAAANADADTQPAEQKGDYADDEGGDDDDDGEMDEAEQMADPLMAAVESGTISAAEATTLAETAEKMDSDVVAPVIDAISENDLDVENAVDLLNAMGSMGGDAMPDEGAKDAAGELKAASDEGDADAEADAEAAAAQKADDADADAGADAEADADATVDADAIDERIEAKLDARLDGVITESDLDARLDDVATKADIDALVDDVSEKMTAEVSETLQKASTTESPTPMGGGTTSGSRTLGDIVTSQED